MSDKQVYLVELEVGDVPKDVYKKRGQEEIAYTQKLVQDGTIKNLVVTKNRRKSWFTIEVPNQEALQSILEGFPLKEYFTLNQHEVIDLVAAIKSGKGRPPS